MEALKPGMTQAVKPGTVLSRDIADYPEGLVLVIDKPWRWTSADVIRKIKFAAIRHFNKKNLKVGHAGTLDPLADGVLIVCIGAATKRAEEYQKHDKEYLCELIFGATTSSYDLEKEPDAFFPTDGIDAESVAAALEQFRGEQMQVAPLFSAKNIDGVRAYELARKAFAKGEKVDDELIRASRVVISRLDLLDFGAYQAEPGGTDETPDQVGGDGQLPQGDGPTAQGDGPTPVKHASSRIHVADIRNLDGYPQATLRVRCSKGTYIRALARDLGEALGSGAFISRLRRSASGDFTLREALTMDQALALFPKA